MPRSFGNHVDVLLETAIDRAETSLENYREKLLEFLMYVSEDVLAVTYHQADALRDTLDIVRILCTKMAKYSSRTSNGKPFYDDAALALNKRLWDLMSRDKMGSPKENMFIEWCNKCKECGSFKSLALNMLAYNLTPEQQHEAKYQICEDGSITGPQRSWINSMLRKHLGDSKVAYYIFHHGLPGLLDFSLREEVFSKAMLRILVEEFMTWHVSLLQSILEHRNHPNMLNAQRQSAHGEKKWNGYKRETEYGRHLLKDRDSKKRSYEEMSASEHSVLEDFCTSTSEKCYVEECNMKMPFFIGKKW